MAEAAARLREPGAEAPQSIFTKDALDSFITADKKAFLKTRCAQCDGNAGLTKKYKDTMTVIITNMTDQFWCRDCGRVLCDQHRYNHTCERIDAEKEKRKNITHEELLKQIVDSEARKEADELAEKEAKRMAQEIIEQGKSERKAKRKILAIKAKHVESFIQSCARNPEGRPKNVHNELLEIYPKATRISLALYNQFEHPDSQEVGGEDWEDMKGIYERATELTHMRIMTEEGPLDMRNPWDPPAEDQEAMA